MKKGVCLLVVLMFVSFVFAAQDSTPPTPPGEGKEIDWNIGSIDGSVCVSTTEDIGFGSFNSVTGNTGSEGRLIPNLVTVNEFCRQYTQQHDSHATLALIHKYMSGCDNSGVWWENDVWNSENTRCDGDDNIAKIVCADGCSECSDGIDNDNDSLIDYGTATQIIRNVQDVDTVTEFISQTNATKHNVTSVYHYGVAITDLGGGVTATAIASLGSVFHLNGPKYSSKTKKRLGLSGDEHFDVDFGSDVYSFGWMMYEPSVAPDTGTSGGVYISSGFDSMFTINLKKDGTLVKSFQMNSKDYEEEGDENMFFGVWIDEPFNKIEFRETVSKGSTGSNEWFGPFYVGTIAKARGGDPDCSSPDDYESPGCRGDSECPPGTYCDLATNSCVECTQDSHCDDSDSGTVDSCVSNVCVWESGLNSWTDMNGGSVANVDLNDYVRISSASNPPYDIKEGASVILEDLGKKYWKADEAGSDIKFVSSIGESDNSIDVGSDQDDDDMSINVLSPKCGSNYSLTEDRLNISFIIDDSDDYVTGNVTVDNVRVLSFDNSENNLFVKISDFDSAGNIPVIISTVNSRGKRARKVLNVMVYDPTNSADQYYVAACIDKPVNFFETKSSLIEFEATSSKAIHYDSGSDEITELDQMTLNFSWSFWNQGGKVLDDCVGLGSQDCNGLTAVDWSVVHFFRRFPTIHDNRATLSVSIPA
jgi:hypothetical protein